MPWKLSLTEEAKAKHSSMKDAAKKASIGRNESGRTAASAQEGLFAQAHKTLQLLADNPRHPGLNTHKYDEIVNPIKVGDPVFEAYAQNKTPGAYRVFWCYGPGADYITIIAITPHP